MPYAEDGSYVPSSFYRKKPKVSAKRKAALSAANKRTAANPSPRAAAAMKENAARIASLIRRGIAKRTEDGGVVHRNYYPKKKRKGLQKRRERY